MVPIGVVPAGGDATYVSTPPMVSNLPLASPVCRTVRKQQSPGGFAMMLSFPDMRFSFRSGIEAKHGHEALYRPTVVVGVMGIGSGMGGDKRTSRGFGVAPESIYVNSCDGPDVAIDPMMNRIHYHV